MAHSRRLFLRNTAAASILATPALQMVMARPARASGFGPLVEDPAGVLDLPEGFSYTILQEAGDVMSDGFVVPTLADGMACFEGALDGTVVLMRNHEISGLGGAAYDRGSVPDEAYTDNNGGGVTRVVVNLETLEVVSSNLVLSGTVRNCAGGTSPMGWLTCEEPGAGLFNTNHGFVFLCDDSAESIQEPVRIDGYGRFNHEAAVMDPATMIAYLTEDQGDGCFYRFVPDDAAQPFVGTLQALRVVGEDTANTSDGRSVGDTFSVGWVDIDEPVPGVIGATRREGQDKGAAVFNRGEGLWLHDGDVYFSCTSGGPNDGQIFKLTPAGDGGVLELIAQSTGDSVLEKPDNICVAPWGDVYVAEDGGRPNFIRVVTGDGELFDFARNAGSGSEFAGVCFSPDGSTLFVNIQADGLTFAVTGPFPQVEPPDEPGGGDGDGDGDTTGGDTTTGGDGDGDTTGGDGDGTTTTGGDGDGDGDGTGGDGTGETDEDPTTPPTDDDGSGCAVGGAGSATGLAAAAAGLAVSAALASKSRSASETDSELDRETDE